MASTVSITLTYAAPPDQVAALLRDPAFREEVTRGQRAVRASVTVAGDAAAPKVTVDSTQAADKVPGFAKKFVGDEIRIVQEETWRSAHAADVAITIPGKPGEVTGTTRLDAADGGAGTTQVVDLSVAVRIPLVGGKIEGLIGDMLTKALRVQERVAAQRLG